jgi:hypothetical protein
MVKDEALDESLTTGRLKELHASAGGNTTLWSDLYFQTVHSSSADGVRNSGDVCSGGNAEHRTKADKGGGAEGKKGVGNEAEDGDDGAFRGGEKEDGDCDRSSGVAAFRQRREIRQGAIRTPTRLGHGALVEVLPPLKRLAVFRAYVVHVPRHTERWSALEANFKSVSPLIRLYEWPALPLNHPRLAEAGAGTRSNQFFAFKSLTLSMTDAWQHWAQHGLGSDRPGHSHDEMHEADEWAFFLEDDVDWHPEIKDRPDAISAALMQGLRLAQKDGLAILGWCEPKFAPFDHWRSEAVVVRRGNGMCGHAMAMTRWRAGSLAAELSTFRTGDVEMDVHIDVLLRQWIRKGEGGDFGSLGGVWLLGANLTITSPPPGVPSVQVPANMAGLLFQDRASHHSHTQAGR